MREDERARAMRGLSALFSSVHGVENDKIKAKETVIKKRFVSLTFVLVYVLAELAVFTLLVHRRDAAPVDANLLWLVVDRYCTAALLLETTFLLKMS